MDVKRKLCERLEYAERLFHKAKTTKEISYSVIFHNQVTKNMMKHGLMKEYLEIISRNN